MDAYDISEKIKRYWTLLIPKTSGSGVMSRKKITVVVNTEYGYREVVGVYINEDRIELVLDKE
jgi:hypothetical protein